MRKTYGLTFAVFVMGTTSTVALAQTPTPADELLIADTVVIGSSGGVAVKEGDSIYQSGPITAIRVCHGDRLDSIQVSYGLRQGKKIGGNGGVCDDVPIKEGQKVTAVRVRQGNWIDGIQFQIDGQWSDHYGGLGGVERTERSDGGGALAYIEGRVGDKIDQLSFAFGLPYIIKNVKYDQQAIKDQLALSPIERIGWQCFSNTTRVEQEVNKEFSQTVTEKVSWDFETTTQWGVEAAYSFGVEGIGEASYSASFGQSFSERRGKEDTKEKTLKDSITTKVPSGAKIQTKFVASKKALNIPFTYTMAHYQNNDRNNIVREKTFSGKFEGVVYTNDNASWEPVTACEAGSPLEELGTPEQQREAKPNAPRAEPQTQTVSSPPQQAQNVTPPVSAASTGTSQAPVAAATTSPLAGSSEKVSRPSRGRAKRPASYSSKKPPAVSAKPARSNETVSCVYATNGSDETAFRLGEDGYWREETVDTGVARFTFAELGRSDGEIMLMDVDRGVFVGLDLNRGKITYSENADGDFIDIYQITRTETE